MFFNTQVVWPYKHSVAFNGPFHHQVSPGDPISPLFVTFLRHLCLPENWEQSGFCFFLHNFWGPSQQMSLQARMACSQNLSAAEFTLGDLSSLDEFLGSIWPISLSSACQHTGLEQISAFHFSLPQPGHSFYSLLCEIMNFNSLSRFSKIQSISVMPWCRLSVVWCSTDILRRLFQEVLKKKNGYQINNGNDSAMMAQIVWK